MQRTDLVVIGAGAAGLAMSRCLARRGIEHVVLERGRVAESWRSARWDSLRLITPNWLTHLPDLPFGGPDPDGFMTAADLAAHLAGYAGAIAAPVREAETVLHLRREAGGYRIETSRGAWRCRAAVIASGACARARLPGWAADLPGSLQQITPGTYRSAEQLPQGGVLVVGASATGVQLAREIQGSGCQVTLAAGRHTRMVRRYRGRDIFAWMDAAGILDRPWTGPANQGRQPSMQLSSGGGVDLARLAAEGVRIVGRALGTDGARLALGRTLAQDCVASDARLERALGQIDSHIARSRLAAPTDPGARAIPPHPAAAADALDLRRSGIRVVVWATGFRGDYPWLDVPVLDPAGEIRHAGGVTPAPGLYALGLPLMRRRSSTFLRGMGRDAEALAGEIAAYLGRPRLAA